MSASKRKGTAWETAVVNYLHDRGFLAAERRALAGALDRGDIAGVPQTTIECKAVQRIELASIVDEAETERGNNHDAYAVSIIKRRGKGVGKAYAVMELDRFCALLSAAILHPARFFRGAEAVGRVVR